MDGGRVHFEVFVRKNPNSAWKLEMATDRRDLAITTDFRDVFAECVTGHLGARDISKVFPGYVYKQPLGILR